jgi:serine/threonine-protein kinase HipA
MLIAGSNNLSQLKTCLETAHTVLLPEDEARSIFEKLISSIEKNWETVCDDAELNKVDRQLLWGRQFLNSYSLTISPGKAY